MVTRTAINNNIDVITLIYFFNNNYNDIKKILQYPELKYMKSVDLYSIIIWWKINIIIIRNVFQHNTYCFFLSVLITAGR